MSERIVELLKKKGNFVSGEEISREFGITRAAVWKKIKALRDKGYLIEASPAKGYRLIKTSELSVEELRTLIKGDIGREIVFLESVDSTNSLSMELADKGSQEGTVVIADSQKKGKGRLGRTWVSPPGVNIHMSIIMRPKMEPKDATLLTIMAAVACVTALRRATELQVTIKWPNDLMVSGKKVGGILTEMKSDPDRIIFAVLGIGINVNMDMKELPPDVRPIATSIKQETGEGQSRTLLIAEILKEIEHWYKVLHKMGRAPLLDEWRVLTSTLGREVRVTVGEEAFTGMAEAIDEEGMLILRLPSGALKKIIAGDLIILR